MISGMSEPRLTLSASVAGYSRSSYSSKSNLTGCSRRTSNNDGNDVKPPPPSGLSRAKCPMKSLRPTFRKMNVAPAWCSTLTAYRGVDPQCVIQKFHALKAKARTAIPRVTSSLIPASSQIGCVA